MKLLYVVRNPIDRIVSAWKMAAREKPEEFTDFNRDILDTELRRWFVDRSRYWFQISAWRDAFPDNQIKILFFDEFLASPLPVLKQCADFLGLSNWQGYTHVEKAHMAAPRAYIRMLRRIPGYASLRQLFPEKLYVAAQVKGFTHLPSTDTMPTWDRAVLQAVVSELKEDMDTFLQYAGKPLGYWDICECP